MLVLQLGEGLSLGELDVRQPQLHLELGLNEMLPGLAFPCGNEFLTQDTSLHVPPPL
jgi:hypothetical protein